MSAPFWGPRCGRGPVVSKMRRNSVIEQVEVFVRITRDIVGDARPPPRSKIALLLDVGPIRHRVVVRDSGKKRRALAIIQKQPVDIGVSEERRDKLLEVFEIALGVPFGCSYQEALIVAF